MFNRFKFCFSIFLLRLASLEYYSPVSKDAWDQAVIYVSCYIGPFWVNHLGPSRKRSCKKEGSHVELLVLFVGCPLWSHLYTFYMTQQLPGLPTSEPRIYSLRCPTNSKLGCPHCLHLFNICLETRI